jgi:tripartite-type tricarboxylate transporter receptor subunit TctC
MKRLLLLCALCLPALAHAQAWPARPITLVVPFPAGGPSDVLARRYAQSMGAALAGSMVVENIGGAGGTIGTAKVARAPADGYTLAFGTIGTHAANMALYRNPGYDPQKDFEPVALLGTAPLVLVARQALPAKTFREFVDYAKTNTGKLSYGSAGAGSISHMGCLLLMAEMGTDIVHVPYKGVAPAMNDLLGGQIDFLCDQTTTVLPQLKGGRIKALAVLTREPSSVLPDVPTAAANGYPNLNARAWNGLFAPKGTPPEIVGKLGGAVAKSLADPEFRKALEELGITLPTREEALPPGLPQRLANFVSSDMGRLVPLLKSKQQYLD